MPDPLTRSARVNRAARERAEFAAMLLDALTDPDIRRQVRAALHATDREHQQQRLAAGGYAATASQARQLKQARLATRGGRNG